MISILVGSVVMFIVGALWFTVLFGKKWSELMGRTPDDMERYKKQGSMASKMITMFVLNLISTSVVVYLFPLISIMSLGMWFLAVIVVWLGFTLPSLMNTYLWEGKSWMLVCINATGSLVSFLIMSGVVYWLR